MSGRWKDGVPTGPNAIQELCEADEEYRRLRRKRDAVEAASELAWATANASNKLVGDATARLNQRMFRIADKLRKSQAEKEADK